MRRDEMDGQAREGESMGNAGINFPKKIWKLARKCEGLGSDGAAWFLSH